MALAIRFTLDESELLQSSRAVRRPSRPDPDPDPRHLPLNLSTSFIDSACNERPSCVCLCMRELGALGAGAALAFTDSAMISLDPRTVGQFSSVHKYGPAPQTRSARQ